MGEGGKFKVRTTSAKGDATEVKSNMMWQEKEDQGGSPLFPSHSIDTYSSLSPHPICLPILSPFLALPHPRLCSPPLHEPSLHDKGVEEEQRYIQHNLDSTGDGDVGKWRVDTWHCAIGPSGGIAPK